MQKQLQTTDAIRAIDALHGLIGNHNLSNGHYLLRHYGNYFDWCRRGRPEQRIPRQVLELATFADAVMTFEQDWREDPARQVFTKKIQSRTEAKGLLFEFRTGAHFRRLYERVSWLSNNLAKTEPDICISTDAGDEVMVECTVKQERPSRTIDALQMQHDIHNSIIDKQKQHSLLSKPLILAIYVPEDYGWTVRKANEGLRDAIRLTFQEGCCAISAVTVISSEAPKLRTDDLGRTFYDTSSLAYLIGNATARHLLPIGFRLTE